MLGVQDSKCVYTHVSCIQGVPMGLSETPVSLSVQSVTVGRRVSLPIYSARVVLTDKLSTWIPTSLMLRTDQGSSAQGATGFVSMLKRICECV